MGGTRIMGAYCPTKVIISDVKVHGWNPKNTFGIIYGCSGCGKTTELVKLTKKGLKTFVIDCDRGGQIGKTVAANSASSYEDVADIIYSIKPNQFDIIAIDSIDVLVDTFIRKRFSKISGLDHPGDSEWGKGWDQEKNLFKQLLASLSEKNAHILCIGHSNTIEKDGKREVLPCLRAKMFNIIADIAQYVIYIKMSGSARIPIVAAQEGILAKDRTNLFPRDMPNLSFGNKEEFALTNAFKKGFENGI